MNPDDARELLAAHMRKVGEIQQRVEQTQAQIKSSRARATSADNSVSVELAPGGRLEELRIANEAMRMGSKQLADVIKQTVQAAHTDAARQAEHALQPLVGESDAMEFLRDQIGLNAEEDNSDAHFEQPSMSANNAGREEGDTRRNENDDDFGGPVLRR